MSSTPSWGAPPMYPHAVADEVHVWRIPLDLAAPHVERLGQALNDEERTRTARFHFDRDRRQYQIVRGALRAILSRYVDAPPGDLAFVYNATGKPALRCGPGEQDLRFNISHSGRMALIAVALGRDIGVDIELIRGNIPTEEIENRFFAPAEVASIRALPAADRRRAFFHCWTRKEAYLKARGEGLSLAIKEFELPIACGETADVLAISDHPSDCPRWWLRELVVGSGYAAAMAVEGDGWSARLWRWPSGSSQAIGRRP